MNDLSSRLRRKKIESENQWSIDLEAQRTCQIKTNTDMTR